MEILRVLLRMLRAGVPFCALVLFLMQAAPAQSAAGCCCGTGASTCAASDGCATLASSCACSLERPASTLGVPPAWSEALAPAVSTCLGDLQAGAAPRDPRFRPPTRSDRPQVRPPRVG